MKNFLFMVFMVLTSLDMVAQEAVVEFKSPVQMPKEMKGKDWHVLSSNNDGFIIYSFKDGKLNLARLDASGNVKQQVEHKNTQFSLMNIFSNVQEIAVLTYDSKIGGIMCNTYDSNTFTPKGQKTLVEKRKDVFDSYNMSISENGQYIALLTNYVQKNWYHHKLYLFDRDFNILTTNEVLPPPEMNNVATVLETDMEVSNEGKVFLLSFRTLLNNARNNNGEKPKLTFGKAVYFTADFTVQIGVDIVSKDGQQHYDIDNSIGELAMRPNMIDFDNNHLLIGMFVGSSWGAYAGGFALTNDYVTLECDLQAKTVKEKGKLSLPGGPWSCLMMTNNNPVRMSNVIKMIDGSYIVPTDKNPRDPYNRFEVNFNREFIWADADGSNLTFGSWGSMTVRKQPFVIGGVSTDGGMSVRFPYASKYWLIDIPETEVGTGTLRSCTRDGKITQSTPAGFQNITANSHIISEGDGKFTVLNMGKQDKEFTIQVGSVEMK